MHPDRAGLDIRKDRLKVIFAGSCQSDRLQLQPTDTYGLSGLASPLLMGWEMFARSPKIKWRSTVVTTSGQ